ncbi:MAG: hypothetical protein ACK5MD_04435 [Flavobacteriales bacterium]
MNLFKIHCVCWLFLGLIPVKSQTVIYEENIKYGNSYGNALLFQIPYCSKKIVKTQWKESVSTHFGKTSFKNVFKGISITDADLKGISNQPVDVYYRILDTKTDTLRIATAFVLNGGEFLSKATHPKEYQNAVHLLTDYAYTVKKKCIELELQDAYDYQGTLNDDYVKLQRFKGKLEKENTLLENKIIQTQQKTTDNTKQLKAIKNELEKGTLNEKESSKYTKKKESLERKLIDYKDDISSYQVRKTENNDNITKTYKDIVKKAEELKDQKTVIQDVKRKIKEIKK